VQLAGRLGQDPRIRTTPKGTLIASFPLGVKDEADLEKTTWHTVLAFRERAQTVHDTLKKGMPVEVIGYVHERAIPRRDGSTRTVQEVYATVVRPVTGR
jgi:single stranded DNA-binding protein